MKRFIRWLPPALGFALLAVLSTVVPVGGSAVALATTTPAPASTAAAPSCPAGEVALSVPIFASDGNCLAAGSSGNVITAYVILFLKLIGGLIGGIIILMLLIAGIQYITSAGNASLVKAAKDRIINAITALVLFAFMYAILNFLIPGGIFG